MTPPALPRALQGIRVLDFTWVRAGPWATRWLGALGAEVIKVEWPENERGRQSGGNTTPGGLAQDLNTGGNFNDTNCNKLSITLNVRSPRGKDLIRRLVSASDAVIENFSSRVLRSWGLGYEELCKLRPDIVYVSMSGFGHTGRHHHYKTFGPVAQAISGLTFLSGLPGKPPAGWGWSYLDDTGGLYGAMGVLTGIYHRNVTGEGQHIDLSQMIAGITLNGPAILDRTVNGRPSRREGFPPGNRTQWPGTQVLDNYRGPQAAPHNAYRTHPGGYNDWCVIACFSDEEWRRLVQLMGAPAWSNAAEYDDLKGRLRHQAEIDLKLEAWTSTQDKYELTRRCQEAGVRAMPVQSSEDRVEHDPQLRHRDMYRALEHPELGLKRLQNAPFKLSATPAVNHRPGPLIGQHNQQVFEDILGLPHGDLVSGYEDGTFWPVGRPRYPYMEEPSAGECSPPADAGGCGGAPTVAGGGPPGKMLK